MAPVRRILKTLNTRNYSKNDIEMSYTQIGHEHLETLEDTHILLFHEEQQKAEEIEFKFIKTGLDKKQTLKYYKEKNVNNLVKKFANFAKKNNLSGLVCSPLEINIVRQEVGKNMILVVPGIRPIKKISSKKDDQKRTLNPKQAIDLGADFLVIGRPIIESKNPLKTIKEINQSIK